MVENFIYDFLLTDDEEWEWVLGGLCYVHMVKRDLTDETCGVYGCLKPGPKNGKPQTYTLVAVIKYGDNNDVRFFDSDFFRWAFVTKERKALLRFSGKECFTIEQVCQDVRDSFAGKWNKKKLFPLPGSVDSKEEMVYRRDISEFQFEPEAKNDVDVRVSGAVDLLKEMFYCENDGSWFCYEGAGWYREMALRWLAATTSKNYPYFDMQSEKAAYLSTIDQLSKKALANSNDFVAKTLAMKNAVDGYDVVSIEIVCNDGSKERLDVFAEAFRKYNHYPNIDEDVIELENECVAPTVLDAIAHKLPSALAAEEEEYDEEYPPLRWTIKKNVVAIWSKDGKKLWPQ